MPVTKVVESAIPLVIRGKDPRAELRYDVHGSNMEEWEAHEAVLAAAPTLFDFLGSGLFFLPRRESYYEEASPDFYKYVVQYSGVEGYAFAFETVGGTARVQYDLATLGVYPAGAPWPYNLVGLKPDGTAEGVDIPVAVYRWCETWPLTSASVTQAYKNLVSDLTPCINNWWFRGFRAYEVLFLGVTGCQRNGGAWEMCYHFAREKTLTNLRIGDITGIDKPGQAYLEVVSKPTVSEFVGKKYLVPKPTAVYVHRMFESADFALLGIGTA